MAPDEIKAAAYPFMQVYITFSARNPEVYEVGHPGVDLFFGQFVPGPHLPLTAMQFHQIVVIGNDLSREEVSGQQCTTEEGTTMNRTENHIPGQRLTNDGRLSGKTFCQIQVRLSITDTTGHGRSCMSYEINFVHA